MGTKSRVRSTIYQVSVTLDIVLFTSYRVKSAPTFQNTSHFLKSAQFQI